MQKQFITPIKFWLAGVIAITVLFAGCSSTTLIKGHDKGVGKNITETKEWVLGGEAPQIHRGKKICLRIDPETGCNRPVKCKGGAPRTDGKLLKDFLKLPDSSPNPHITVPAPSEWPHRDLLDANRGISSPNTSRIASSSFVSPTGVLVP